MTDFVNPSKKQNLFLLRHLSQPDRQTVSMEYVVSHLNCIIKGNRPDLADNLKLKTAKFAINQMKLIPRKW